MRSDKRNSELSKFGDFVPGLSSGSAFVAVAPQLCQHFLNFLTNNGCTLA
jgi:hypothetical protein